MFVDIHSHIISGIDDGAKDLKTTVEMLKLAASNGTLHIFGTPHFISGAVLNTSDVVDEKCRELQKLISNEAININVYSGTEVFMSQDMPELYDNGAISTLNNSSYILVELPMMCIPLYTKAVLYNLQIRGLIPIIAHPERNNEISVNPVILTDLVNRGMLAQVNSGSITGLYGKKIQNVAMKFIKMGLIHFVASDAHTCRGRSPSLVKAAEIVRKRFGNSVVNSLFFKNGMKVLENGNVPV